ncbi:hypothetical protein BDK92_2490 [Micromonospora pisi]|uniref:Uncharacterized protein n=1 Tax=Micromonospora pisi TaxID=589240 RepID=A0A495JIM8_9ACTN|nr:hypothetical protein BDK92_2490 [Micromonospora pisi]
MDGRPHRTGTARPTGEPYALAVGLGEQRPALGKRETDSLVNHFRNVVGEFCGVPDQ